MAGDVVTSRVFNVGDIVELVVGKYAGLRGRVSAKQPRLAPFAVRIKVDVDLIGYNGPLRDRLRERFKQWQRVASWKRVVE